ncbi:MAG: PEGA domain-containing protein [Methanobacteriota archaeon]
MSIRRSIYYTPLIRYFSIILAFLALSILIGACGVAAEKTPTIATIGIVPEAPTIEQSYHVTGKLSTTSGEALGNKRVTLETSQKGTDAPESFSFLAIGDTSKEGLFDFFRPKNTLPEFLRVSFAGNTEYEATSSPILSARGAGTNSPQRRTGTGTITVSTNPAGADIFIDTIYRGLTPGMIGGLAEGAHSLEVGKVGYQNETMEAYVTPDRGCSFSITLNPGGLGLTQTNFTSSLSYSRNVSEPLGEPDLSINFDGTSMRLYGNATNLSVNTLESDDPVTGGHNYMVIMTDH